MNNQKSEQLYMLLEIPKGTKAKYEFNENFEKLVLDRITPLTYPFNYGQIFAKGKKKLKTLGEDGDALDVICLGKPYVVGCLIPIRLLGILRMVDDGEQDDKLIAVVDKDKNFEQIKSINQLSSLIKKEIEFFFNNYKTEMGKTIKIQGWENQEKANETLEKAQALYKLNDNNN